MTIQPKKIVQKLGLYQGPQDERKNYIRLDFNENTVGFPQVFFDEENQDFTAYPEYTELNVGLAKLYGVSEASFVTTNGSDEALFAIAHTYIEPGVDKALVSKPTFVTICHSLVLAGAELVEINCTSDLEFDCDAIENALAAESFKIAFFASPDNPTGAALPIKCVESWCKKFPETLFVIDEAYSEYAGESALSLIAKYPNLLVTRTFSKAWGLASLRLGVIIGAPELIAPIYKVRLPYTVNGAAAAAVVKLLPFAEDVLSEAKATMARKSELLNALRKRGLQFTPGCANFFLLQVGEQAPRFCAYLRDAGVLVRNRSVGSAGANPLWGMVRISVGTSSENQKLLDAIDSYFEIVGVATSIRQSTTKDELPKAAEVF